MALLKTFDCIDCKTNDSTRIACQTWLHDEYEVIESFVVSGCQNSAMLCQHCDGFDTHDIVTYHRGSKRLQDSDGQQPRCMMNKSMSKRKIDDLI